MMQPESESAGEVPHLADPIRAKVGVAEENAAYRGLPS